MEFDSPEEVEKEFPGLYGKTEQVEMMSDSVDYDEGPDKKKKKDKKDSKKDKGYATLADENSQDEDDTGESHQSKKKLKGLLSGKKKDKEKEHKEKDSKKEKKLLEKEKKTLETERKSGDREVPFSSVRIPFSAERHRDINAHRSSVPTALFASTPKSGKDKTGAGESSCSPVAVVEKERSSSSAFNAFINAPTPLFLQKKKKKKEEKELKDKVEKEHKKEKLKSKEKKEEKEKDKEKHPSGVAKVKLKLMRSKNSLDDPHEKEKGDLHVSVSHQFPEDPEALAKEIKKHEALLEQTHGQMKSCKKVTKKQEEQLWELQRTLTALKRKLRSINALSVAHSHAVLAGVGPSSSMNVVENAPDKGTSQSPNGNTIPRPLSSSTSPIAVSDKNNKHLEQRVSETEDLSKKILSSSTSPTTHGDTRLKDSSPSKSETEKQGCVAASSNVPLKKQAFGEPHQESIPVILPPPGKRTARRSLDFSDIVVENSKKPVKSNSNTESRMQTCCSAVESCVEQEKVDDDYNDQQPPPPAHPRDKRESPVHNKSITEHEKMEVQAIVHQESKEEEDEDEVDIGRVDDDDSSVARSEEDEDEALPSTSSRNEENINIVLDDANAMIGSMHEELEAAAFVFGQKLSKRGSGGGHGGFKPIATVSKSEPTFETNEDSSDVELIRDEDEEDELPESFIEELIPELLCLPEFETPEYLSFENEQLATFNKAIQEEIMKEETELEVVMEEWENIRGNKGNLTRTEDDSSEDDCDMEQLIETWKTAKSENDALQANVSRLRQLVALHRLDEFRLETRLRFLEDKIQPIISPVTATTPLHSET